MSIDVVSWVWKHAPRDLGSSSMVLLLALAETTIGEGGFAVATNRRLQQLKRMSKRTVQRQLDDLARRGILDITKDPTHRFPTVYRFTFVPAPEWTVKIGKYTTHDWITASSPNSAEAIERLWESGDDDYADLVESENGVRTTGVNLTPLPETPRVRTTGVNLTPVGDNLTPRGVNLTPLHDDDIDTIAYARARPRSVGISTDVEIKEKERTQRNNPTARERERTRTREALELSDVSCDPNDPGNSDHSHHSPDQETPDHDESFARATDAVLTPEERHPYWHERDGARRRMFDAYIDAYGKTFNLIDAMAAWRNTIGPALDDSVPDRRLIWDGIVRWRDYWKREGTESRFVPAFGTFVRRRQWRERP